MRLSGGELRNISWLLSEHIARILSGFFIGVVVARYMGPADFGVFSYITSIVAICAAFARLGIDAVIIRILAEDPDNQHRYLNNVISLRLLSSVVVFVISAAVVAIVPGESRIKFYTIVMLASLLFSAAEVVDFFYQAQVRSKYATLCRFSGLCISGAMKIYCVFTGKPVEYFFYIFLIDAIVLNIIYAAVFRFKERRFVRPSFDKQFALRVLRLSWPLMASSLATTAYMRIDQIIILHYLDNQQVGLYAAAGKIVEAFYVLPMLVSNTLFPALVIARKGGEAVFEAQLIRLYRINVGVSVLFAIIMTAAAPFAVNVLFGSAYAASADVLMIEVWGAVFMALLISSGKYLVAVGDTTAVLQRNLGAAVINILLNLALIPALGIIGAACASLVSTLFAAVFYDMLSKSHWPMLRTKAAALGFGRE